MSLIDRIGIDMGIKRSVEDGLRWAATHWHPIRDADRLAAYRAAAGPLPAWWDRCVATAPAGVCPCGSYQVRWGEGEAT